MTYKYVHDTDVDFLITFIGIVRRRCREDGKWDDEFVECFREATELFDQVATYMCMYYILF